MTAGAAAGPLEFSYARSLAPMMWVMIGLSLVEIGVVHLLVALLWSQLAALILSLATAAGLVWLVLLIRSFRRLPVQVIDGRILLRVGFMRSIEILRQDVAALRGAFTGDEVKQAGVLNLALLAFPNVLVVLKHPVPLGRRRIGAVAHRLDDPAAFFAALGGDGP